MDQSAWEIANMATEKQIEANRKNALKSTGPKTTDGKARSSKNAIKHGLTSEALVLGDEKADELKTRVDAWNTDLRPRNVAERALLTRAAESCWRLERCLRAERAQHELLTRHAIESYDLQQLRRANDLGRSLLDDPINRCVVPRDDKDTRDALAAWYAVEPSLVVRELESFAQGVNWLIDRYHELGTILETEGFWHYPEKYLAVRLLGKRPEDALRDREIGKIFMACRALHPEPWDATADFQQAALGQKGRPIYGVRVEFLETHESMSAEQALNHLRIMVRSRLADLQTLKDEQLDEIDRIDRALAVQAAVIEKSKLMEHAVRYKTAREREVSRSMNLYLKLRKLEVVDTESVPDATSPSPIPKAAAKATLESRSNTKSTAKPAVEPAPVSKPQPPARPVAIAQKVNVPWQAFEPDLRKDDPETRPIVLRGNRRKNPLELIKQQGKSQTDEPKRVPHIVQPRDRIKRTAR